MKKDSLWSIIVGVLFVSLLTGLFFIWNTLGKPPKEPETVSNVPISSNLPVDPNFTPNPNDKLSFEASSTIIPYEGAITTTFVQHDGRGSVRFEAKQDGVATEFFLTPSSTIICDDFQCYAIAPDPNDKEMNIDEYVFTALELNALGQELVLSGNEPCGVNICEVWTPPLPVDAEMPRVLLDSVTKNIIHVSEEQASGIVSIDFEYKETKIVLPLNIEDLN